MRHIFVYLTALLIFAGCLEQGPNMEAEAPAPVFKIKAFWSDQAWTDHVVSELKLRAPEMLKSMPTDAATFGLKKTMTESEKLQFWVYLISAISKRESSFKPESNYYECNKNKCVYDKCRQVEGRGFCMLGGSPLDGGLVISRGLGQMSFSSSVSNGCTFIKEPKDLNDPLKNLSCMVVILNKWVLKDNAIGTEKKGGARYWSVLRESSSSRPKIIEMLKGVLK